MRHAAEVHFTRVTDGVRVTCANVLIGFLLAAVAAGCASNGRSTAAGANSRAASGGAAAALSPEFASTTTAAPVSSTADSSTADSSTADSSSAVAAVNDQTDGTSTVETGFGTGAPTSGPLAGVAPPPTTSASPSLAAWSPPLHAIALPAPDGPSSVGIAASGFPDTVVFYPALAGTGRGRHRYVDPAWAQAAGLDPASMDRVTSAAQIDATPAPTQTPRPVVLLSPGWRSVVAFSTSLAEDLASHGYVVLATQTDVRAEWSHPASTSTDRSKRSSTLTSLLDFLQGPSLAKLVGPIDLRRIAVGGHSYAASIAFDASLSDPRIGAMFDLDGNARDEANRRPPTKPTLVLVTVNNGAVADPLLGTLAARSTRIVAAGVLDALHLDVTDAASIPSLLGTSVFSTLVGTVGQTGTIDTSTIVVRYLDAVFGAHPHHPSSGELVHGLQSATADPFGSQRPATSPTDPP